MVAQTLRPTPNSKPLSFTPSVWIAYTDRFDLNTPTALNSGPACDGNLLFNLVCVCVCID